MSYDISIAEAIELHRTYGYDSDPIWDLELIVGEIEDALSADWFYAERAWYDGEVSRGIVDEIRNELQMLRDWRLLVGSMTDDEIADTASFIAELDAISC